MKHFLKDEHRMNQIRYELNTKERIVWLGKQTYRDPLAEGEIFERGDKNARAI